METVYTHMLHCSDKVVGCIHVLVLLLEAICTVWIMLLSVLLLEPINEPVDIVNELELPTGEIGEIIVSGWHVNTYQVRLP